MILLLKEKKRTFPVTVQEETRLVGGRALPASCLQTAELLVTISQPVMIWKQTIQDFLHHHSAGFQASTARPSPRADTPPSAKHALAALGH